MKTITQIPEGFQKGCEVFLNDGDEDVVARNIVLLLTALCLNIKTAPEALIHLWYSALIPRSILDSLETDVLPLISEMCGKVEKRSENSLFATTWKFEPCKLRVVLNREQWARIPQYFRVPVGLDAAKACQVRLTVCSECS